MMRRVWRYEDDKGMGPYDQRDLLDAHREPHYPGPLTDFGDLWWMTGAGERKFGCDSYASLHAWFKGWHDWLQRRTWHIAVYEVPAEDVFDGESGKQVMYLTCRARRLR